MSPGATWTGSRPSIQTALIDASGSWPGAAIAAATPVAPGSSSPRDTAYRCLRARVIAAASSGRGAIAASRTWPGLPWVSGWRMPGR